MIFSSIVTLRLVLKCVIL